MAHESKVEKEKKTVPVNVLLTEETNIELSKLALQVSTPEERISKSDIVRASLEAGLPLLDFVKKQIPELPIAQVPGFLIQKPVIDTLQQLARGAVRSRGAVRTRGSIRDDDEAFAAPKVNHAGEVDLISPVNTGVYQAPTFSWKLQEELIKAHLSAPTGQPIRCRVRVTDGEQEVWSDAIEIVLPKDAKPAHEAQRGRSVAMPHEVFAQLSPLSWKRWVVQVSYRSATGTYEREGSALFMKITPYQAARAQVEGLMGQGRSYQAHGLLEESAAFFREAMETTCQQLSEIYRIRGLAQAADAYQRLLEEIKKLP